MQITLANSLRPSCFFSSTPSENIRSTDPPIIICYKYCDVVCRHKIDHDPEEYKKCASACMLRCKGWFARKRRNTWSRMCAKRCMKGITDVVPRKYMECAFRCMLDFRRMVERKWRWPWQLISRLACMNEFSLAFSSLLYDKNKFTTLFLCLLLLSISPVVPAVSCSFRELLLSLELVSVHYLIAGAWSTYGVCAGMWVFVALMVMLWSLTNNINMIRLEKKNQLLCFS